MKATQYASLIMIGIALGTILGLVVGVSSAAEAKPIHKPEIADMVIYHADIDHAGVILSVDPIEIMVFEWGTAAREVTLDEITIKK